MRHRKAGVKLNRTSSHRQAMFRNMVTSLFKYDRIKTTDAKAKELRRWADHIITLAKRGDLSARRQALAIVREKEVVHKLFEEAQKRFGKVNGGYTRIVKLGHRPGDAAAVSLIELVAVEEKAKKKKGKSTAKKKTPAPAATQKAKKTPAKKETVAPPAKADAAEKASEEEVQEADAAVEKDEKAAKPKSKTPDKKPAAKKASATKAPAKKSAVKKDEKEAKPKAETKAKAEAEPEAKKETAKKEDTKADED